MLRTLFSNRRWAMHWPQRIAVVLCASGFAWPQAWGQDGGSDLLRAALQQPQNATRPVAKIIGGEATQIQDNPWQVALVASSRPPPSGQFCGGAIIAPGWVLTAAHCVDKGTRSQQVHVLSGTGSLQDGGVRSRVARIVVHPGWNLDRFVNDIALLQIDDSGPPLQGRPIAGPTADANLMLRFLPFRVSGWGVSARHDEPTMTLQAVDLPYVPQDRCGAPQAYGSYIGPSHLCAGVDEGFPTSCQGDSGGPVSYEFNGVRHLAGVVSFGRVGCSKPYGYGVFTRVASFAQWVEDNTGGAVRWR